MHADRQSEPGVYQREAKGARLSANRRLNTTRLSARDAITGVIDAERGRTLATPVVFCVALQVCTPEDVRAASLSRWRNSISGSWARDRTDRLVDPTRGMILRTSLTWATGLLGSQVNFLRTMEEVSVYRPVRRGWVAAGFLRLGNIWGESHFGTTGDFLPPEDRFYAGGAYSVRGFGRNELGPLVYFTDTVRVHAETGDLVLPKDEDGDDVKVRSVPIGGTSIVVANAELRFPSPVLPRLARLAVFVDAGAVDTLPVWKSGGLKFTPGIGVRVTTPVGPVRADLAYNPYSSPRGPLYGPDPFNTGNIVRIDRFYSPEESGGLLNRLRFHLAVGQAF